MGGSLSDASIRGLQRKLFYGTRVKEKLNFIKRWRLEDVFLKSFL